MARYIDADALLKKIYPMGIGDGMYTINAKAVKFAIDNTPTADVAPKSEVERWRRNLEAVLEERAEERAEVAREIFDEIEDALFNNHCFDEWSDYPTPHYYEELKDDIAELKKKYTEEANQ